LGVEYDHHEKRMCRRRKRERGRKHRVGRGEKGLGFFFPSWFSLGGIRELGKIRVLRFLEGGQVKGGYTRDGNKIRIHL